MSERNRRKEVLQAYARANFLDYTEEKFERYYTVMEKYFPDVIDRLERMAETLEKERRRT